MQEASEQAVIARKNLCEGCFTGKHKCFICNEHTAEVTKCAEKKCGKFYHLKCLQKQNFPHKLISEHGSKFSCPLHICLTCYNEQTADCVVRTVKKKLKTCIKCPTAYHFLDSCIAAGSINIDADHIVCPEHTEPIKTRRKSGKKTPSNKPANVSWCFSCNFGGDLICCEKCPTAKHLACIIEDEGQEPGDGGYLCGDCRARKQLHYNDIVWVKYAGYRWWPAKIIHPTNVPDNILDKKHADADFPVCFFGSNDYLWSNRSRAFIYVEGDDKKKLGALSTGLDRLFRKAMQEVVVAYEVWKMKQTTILQSKTLYSAPFIHLKVNKPYGKFRQPFVDPDRSYKQVCECNEDDPCSSDSCLNRHTQIECDGATCKNQDKCRNQRFKKREYAKTEKFRSQAGWGLRCLEDIKQGDFVIEYVGELIDEKECNKRLKDMANRNDQNFYFLTIDKDTIIDAGPKANLARFMNHSCDPNCETQKWIVNNQMRIGLFAKRFIPAKSELTFDYKLECRGDEKTKCLCNSKNCSGFIGVRPNKIVEEKQSKESEKSTKKRKFKPAFASTHEDECFRCGGAGKLIMCDQRSCPKSYHLECLNLEKIPHGKWVCPVHHCDECGKKAVKFCNHCPTSLCAQHQNANEMQTLANGEQICSDHNASYIKKVIRQIALLSSAVSSKSKLPSDDSSKNFVIPRPVFKSTPKSNSIKSNNEKSNEDLQSESPTKKSRKSYGQIKDEIAELRKKEAEKRRRSVEARGNRMMKRSLNSENEVSLSIRNGPTIAKQRKISEQESEPKSIVAKQSSASKTSDDIDLDFESQNLTNNTDRELHKLDKQDLAIGIESNNSNSNADSKEIANGDIENSSSTSQNVTSSETIAVITDAPNNVQSLTSPAKERIVKQQQEEDKLNNNNSNCSSSSLVKSKGISQKENLGIEIETLHPVGKILSDEILFGEDSEDSYNPATSQPLIKNTSQPQSTNNDSKHHNLKLTTNLINNELNDANSTS